MHHILALYFFVMAVILCGLLYISHTSGDAGRYWQSRRYWSIALVLDVVGLVLFSAFFLSADALAEPRNLGTLSNTALFAAFVFQALSFRALRVAVRRRGAQAALFMVVLFGVMWHLGKGLFSADVKVILFASISVLLLCWQGAETYKNQQALARPDPLRVVMLSLVAEALFCLLRIGVLYDLPQPMISTDRIPSIAIAATWLQLACKVIGYAAVTGYWVEVVTDAKTRTDIENQQFRALSHQQEKLIADLGRLNKTATMGVLAASIAHELNQPLQTAMLNHDMLAHEIAQLSIPEDAMQELLQEQAASLQRIAAIIQTMRGVFSESGATPQKLDVYRLVEDLGPLISSTAKKHGIELRYVHNGNTWICAKASEMQQVILNLVGNAFDALISHKTQQPVVHISVTCEGNQVVCSVADNGPGIAHDMHEEVFKILKTTKNSGMGLGLWLARYITERNQGSIHVSTSEWGGACMSIRMPQVRA